MSDTITQKIVIESLLFKRGYYNGDYDLSDAEYIQKILDSHLHIYISVIDAVEFWKWRSDRYDSNWLTVKSEDDVVDWFKKYIEIERDE